MYQFSATIKKKSTTKDGDTFFVTTLLDNSRYCAKHTFDLHASDISSGELNTSPELGAYPSLSLPIKARSRN